MSCIETVFMKNKNAFPLVIISGPSGVGKGVLIHELLKACPFLFSVFNNS